MDRHYKTRCTVPMINRLTGETDFEVVLYGVEAHQLHMVPNEAVSSLARRYPDHVSSLYAARNGV